MCVRGAARGTAVLTKLKIGYTRWRLGSIRRSIRRMGASTIGGGAIVYRVHYGQARDRTTLLRTCVVCGYWTFVLARLIGTAGALARITCGTWRRLLSSSRRLCLVDDLQQALGVQVMRALASVAKTLLRETLRASVRRRRWWWSRTLRCGMLVCDSRLRAVRGCHGAVYMEHRGRN